MKKILKEPLVHFLLIGLSLFILYGLVNKDVDDDQTIVIDDYDMNNIIASWEMQWKRLPTDDELKSLISQNIKQEIFYQEALKMNLDHNDEIIKRRLAQKMQFLSNDLATLSEPTSEELNDFYQQNVEAYMSPYGFSLYQIIFSPDHRADPKKAALAELEHIKGLDPSDTKNKGDNMPFPYYFEKTDVNELNRQLGMNFSEGLKNLNTNTWEGPVISGFGYHLIYLTEVIPPQEREFASIKSEVLRDFEYENQRKLDEMIFDELKKKYRIEYELDPDKFDETFINFLKTDIN